ncbi:MAG: hypothetical protein ACK55G_06525 [Dolichospermum sp.]
MKEARHIATGRIVRASEVDYSEYYGIFQCPHCKLALRLRKEYTTSNGTTITAAFIHPPGETELEKKCPYRINMNFIDTKSQVTFPLTFPNSREQCFKLLKKNFLKCLKYYGEVKFTDYPKDQETLESISIFMNLNNKIIAAHQNARYILELQESEKIQTILRDKIYEKINSLDPESVDINREITFLESQLSLIKRKSNSVIWGLEFIINEASNNLIEEILNYIFGFGKYVKTNNIEFIELENEIAGKFRNFNSREVKKILGFELSIIKEANNILSDDKLINKFFIQMYKNEFSGSNALIFNEISEIHNLVFEYLINYLVNFPWQRLLY